MTKPDIPILGVGNSYEISDAQKIASLLTRSLSIIQAIIKLQGKDYIPGLSGRRKAKAQGIAVEARELPSERAAQLFRDLPTTQQFRWEINIGIARANIEVLADLENIKIEPSLFCEIKSLLQIHDNVEAVVNELYPDMEDENNGVKELRGLRRGLTRHQLAEFAHSDFRSLQDHIERYKFVTRLLLSVPLEDGCLDSLKRRKGIEDLEYLIKNGSQYFPTISLRKIRRIFPELVAEGKQLTPFAACFRLANESGKYDFGYQAMKLTCLVGKSNLQRCIPVITAPISARAVLPHFVLTADHITQAAGPINFTLMPHEQFKSTSQALQPEI